MLHTLGGQIHDKPCPTGFAWTLKRGGAGYNLRQAIGNEAEHDGWSSNQCNEGGGYEGRYKESHKHK